MDNEPNNTPETAQNIGFLSAFGGGGAINWLSTMHSVATGSTIAPDTADWFRFTHSTTQGYALASVRADIDLNAFAQSMNEGGVVGETNLYRLAPGAGLSGETIRISQLFGVHAHGNALQQATTVAALDPILALGNQLNDLSISPAIRLQLEADRDLVVRLWLIASEIYENDGVNRTGLEVAARLSSAIGNASAMTATGASALANFAQVLSVLQRWDQALYQLQDGGALLGPNYTPDTDTVWATTIGTTALFTLTGSSTVTISEGNTSRTEIRALDVPWLEISTGTSVVANVISVSTSPARSEGSGGGTTNFDYVLRLSNPMTVPVSVQYAVTGSGPAPASAEDFVGGLPSGTATFAAGQTTLTLSIPVRADNIDESAESFTLTLSNPSPGAPNVVIGTATGIGTISDDDDTIVTPPNPVASLTVLTPALDEGQGGGAEFRFRIDLDRPAQSASILNVTVGAVSAGLTGTDFDGGVLPGFEVELAPGMSSRTFVIRVRDDANIEAGETFSVALSAASSGITVGAGSRQAIIRNDDFPPAEAILSSLVNSALEGTTGTGGVLTYEVILTRALTVAATVGYQVTLFGAADAVDFPGGVLPSGEVTFAPGETRKVIEIPLAPDADEEIDEGFAVELTQTSARIVVGGAGFADGVILNDDAPAGDDVLGSTRTSGVLAPGLPATGTIDQDGDRDWFRAELTQGHSYQIDLIAVEPGPLADPFLRAFDAAGDVLFEDDDAGGNYNSRLIYTAGASGPVYFEASGFSDTRTGAYRIEILDLTADATGREIAMVSGSRLLWAGLGDDLVTGSSAADTLHGGAGDDTLQGMNGDDVLHGGGGANVLTGGAGADTFVLRKGDGAALVTDFNPTEDRLEWQGLTAAERLAIVEQSSPEGWLQYRLPDGASLTLEGQAFVNAAPTGAVVITGAARQGGTLTAAPQSIADANGLGALSYTWFADGEVIGRAFGTPFMPGLAEVGRAITVQVSYTDSSGTAESLTSAPAGPVVAVAATAGPDTLAGDDGPNVIDGLAGDDLMFGFAGDDLLQGGAGNDTLIGGAGNDTLQGGSGTNLLNGVEGNNLIQGGSLRDLVYGGSGNDTIHGEAGNDELRGLQGDDLIFGGLGTDTMIGNDGSDTLAAGGGSDLMFGNDGDDFLNGGFGFDRVNGGAGADTFFHQGVADHGSDWVQDYSRAEGDILQFGGAGASQGDFQINLALTAGAGAAGVAEAFVIYRPTGQILWALVDGGIEPSLRLAVGAQQFDLFA